MDLIFFFLVKFVTLGFIQSLVMLVTALFPLFKTLWLSAWMVLEFHIVSNNTGNTFDQWKCNMKAQALLIRAYFFKNAALLYVRLPLHFHDKNRSRVKAIPQKLIHGAYEAIVLAISKVHS